MHFLGTPLRVINVVLYHCMALRMLTQLSETIYFQKQSISKQNQVNTVFSSHHCHYRGVTRNYCATDWWLQPQTSPSCPKRIEGDITNCSLLIERNVVPVLVLKRFYSLFDSCIFTNALFVHCLIFLVYRVLFMSHHQTISIRPEQFFFFSKQQASS